MGSLSTELGVLAITPACFGDLVAIRRRLRGWSQEDLSQKLGIGRCMMGAIERGQRMPSAMICLRLLYLLDIDLQDLATASRLTSRQ